MLFFTFEWLLQLGSAFFVNPALIEVFQLFCWFLKDLTSAMFTVYCSILADSPHTNPLPSVLSQDLTLIDQASSRLNAGFHPSLEQTGSIPNLMFNICVLFRCTVLSFSFLFVKVFLSHLIVIGVAAKNGWTKWLYLTNLHVWNI